MKTPPHDLYNFSRQIPSSTMNNNNTGQPPASAVVPTAPTGDPTTISSASSSSTSLSSAMSHTLLTPNTSDPPTPYLLYPPSSSLAESSEQSSCDNYPVLRTPVPSPTGSPSPETVFTRMLRTRRLVAGAELLPQTSNRGNFDHFDNTLDADSHLEMQHASSPWQEDIRQSFRTEAADQDYYVRHDPPTHFTNTSYEKEEYMLLSSPRPQPPQSLRDFGAIPDLQVDILTEAAKRAEMEILAADINEMQF
ncbi:hypothetical protein V1509DRAFT_627874 [Lipomyces kononenkoae]